MTYVEPDPERAAEYLRIAALLLPGDGTQDVITGYARLHGLTTYPTPEGVEPVLPGSYRIIARILEHRNIFDARMVDTEEVPCTPAPTAPQPRGTCVAPFVPDDLLAELAPAAAITMGLEGGPTDFAEGLREVERPQSTWDPVRGHFGFVELPELPVAAVEIGRYFRETKNWVWPIASGRAVRAVRAGRAAVVETPPLSATSRGTPGRPRQTAGRRSRCCGSARHRPTARRL